MWPLSFTENLETTGIIDQDDTVNYFADGEKKSIMYRNIDRLPIFEKDIIMNKIKDLK